jgi:TonB family protein
MKDQTMSKPLKLKPNLPESGMACPIAGKAVHVIRVYLRAAILVLLLALATAAGAQQIRKTLSAPTPVYPQLAKQLQLKGTVKIQIIVKRDGTVEDANVIGGHPLLVEPALEAVRRWKYEPAGSETTTIVQFNFHP